MASFLAPRLCCSLLLCVCFLSAPIFAAEPRVAATTAQQIFDSALAKQRNGDYPGALADFTRVLELLPRDPNVWTNRGNMRKATGDPDGALADYNKAIELHPRDKNAHICRGNVRREKGDFAGAIADYNLAETFDWRDPLIYRNRGLAHERRGELESALADYNKALQLDSTQADAWQDRGLVRAQKGDAAGALSDLNEAIRLDPRNPIAYYNRAHVLDLAKDPAALADYNKAIELRPGQGAFYRARGLLFARQGRWREASADFDAAARLVEGDLYPALFRYVAQVRLGEAEKGKTSLRAALTRHPAKQDDWPATLGAFLLGQMTEAELIAAARASTPAKSGEQQCEGWYFAGIARLVAGQKEEAVGCFRKSLAAGRPEMNEHQLAHSELTRLESPR